LQYYPLGSDHFYLGVILNNLALLYRDQGRYQEAESLFLRPGNLRESTPA